MYRIVVSTVAFKDEKEAERFYKEKGIPFEFSVNLSPSQVSYLSNANVRCASVHIPSPTRRFFPNFATSSSQLFEKSMDILKESMETLSHCGGNVLVLHPGYAIDALVPSDFKERKPFIEKGAREYEKYIIHKKSVVTGRAYLSSLSYRRHFRLFSENILKVVDFVKAQGFKLAIENLNPRLFYIFQTPKEAQFLSALSEDIYFCLDVGHLYISSLVHGFNFLQGIKDIIETGRVIHFHLSNNPSRVGYYDDAHDHLTKGNIDFPSLLKILSENDANFVLEIKYNPENDIKLLYKLFS